MTSLSQTWISYPTPEGDYRAFCVAPPGAGPWPALIVVHGASGLDPSHRLVTADLAAQGYLAIAPDIYSNDDVFKGFSLATVEAGIDSEGTSRIARPSWRGFPPHSTTRSSELTSGCSIAPRDLHSACEGLP